MNYKYFKILLSILCICIFCIGCQKTSWTEIDGNKKYKKSNGEFAKDEWVKINDCEYYFDRNGNLQIDKWIDETYFVDSEGKKLIKRWYEIDENKFYFGTDGQSLHDTLATIGDKDYYFDSDGKLITDCLFKNNDGKYMIADSDGVVLTDNGIVSIKGKNYFVDNMGIVFTSGWKEIGKDWYYFDTNDGEMLKNKWINATYYIGEDGRMLKNGKSPEGYEVNSEGEVLDKYKNKLLAKDFQYIYETTCKFPWAQIGKDGSYISIDTNPDDNPLASSLYTKDALAANEEILKLLGFPEYVAKKMYETNSLDGKQEEKLGNVTVSWKYSPTNGLEIMYMKHIDDSNN